GERFNHGSWITPVNNRRPAIEGASCDEPRAPCGLKGFALVAGDLIAGVERTRTVDVFDGGNMDKGAANGKVVGGVGQFELAPQYVVQGNDTRGTHTQFADILFVGKAIAAEITDVVDQDVPAGDVVAVVDAGTGFAALGPLAGVPGLKGLFGNAGFETAPIF